MSSFVVVSAADAGYYPMLAGLIASVHRAVGRVPFVVLDLGLTGQQIDALQNLRVKTVIPGWDIKIKAKTVRGRHGEKLALPDTFRAFTAQPFLPKYVPDYETILWLDADCWVQDAQAIDLLLNVAEHQLAIALEVDRSYGSPYWRIKSHIPDFIRAFGLRVGWKLWKVMTANVGVFAMKTDAVHWKLWQEAARTAYARFPHQRSQQMAMQHVIYVDRAPTAFLPALYNWQSWEAVPMFDERTGLLVEPNPPYQPIAIMHNAQADKFLTFDVKTRYSRSTMRENMRYETWAQRQHSPIMQEA